MLLLGLWAAPVRAEKHAIVVGVNACPDFRLPDGGKPRALRGAEADADAMARALIDDYRFAAERVRLLKGPQATAGRIRAAFDALRTKSRPGDVFVFHFSGHGTLVSERDGYHEALCPHDATDKAENLILARDLGLWLMKLPAERVTLILDCCHAGRGFKDPDDDLAVRYLPLALDSDRRPKGRPPWAELRDSTKSLDRWQTAFFACHDDQQAYERSLPGVPRPLRRGQFTYYFLEALRQAGAAGGPQGNRQVLEFVQRRLAETFNQGRSTPVERQEPLLESDEPDGPVFGLRRAAN
ncbi:MAG: caspase domain-containing protein [Thermoguttaceae bacterium]